jgi:hypothetical protein
MEQPRVERSRAMARPMPFVAPLGRVSIYLPILDDVEVLKES